MMNANTNYTYCDDLVWDLHKDAYNHRPSQGFWEAWAAMTPDQKQEQWDRMIDAMNLSIKEEQEQQRRAIVDLEDRIKCMQSTIVGSTREDCIRYLHDVHQTNGDTEFLEYHLGVPYGYLSGRKPGWLV